MSVQLPDGVNMVSLIICTYNRAEDLKNTLAALQNYLKISCIEIIVIDDGSTDNSEEIIKGFNVRYVQNTEKKGIAWVRNIGLQNARGDIIAFIDDDIMVSENWLNELLLPFQNREVMGTGGLITAQNNRNLISLYMLETGYGNPPEPSAKSVPQDTLLQKIKAYYRHNSHIIADSKTSLLSVNEIYGANCAFRREYILGVGGYDNKMRTSEDTDLCRRLKKKYPDLKLIFTLKATAAHKHYTSLLFLLKIKMKRAKDFSILRKKTNQPFYNQSFLYPTLLFLKLPLFFILPPLAAGAFLLLCPQIYYFWWPKRMIKRKRIYPVFFPYIQLLTEITECVSLTWNAARNRV